MSHGFLPRTDNALLAWSRNFAQKISEHFGEYGLSPDQAAEFSARADAYALALRAATDPDTRTRGKVSAKNDARAALKLVAGTLNKIVQANPAVSGEQKIELGLSVARPRSRTAAPAKPPFLFVASVVQHRVRIELRQRTGDSVARGKPHGASGAVILGAVGELPPADLAQWQFKGLASRSSFDISFPSTLAPGTKVWLTAVWFNRRSELGTPCTPIGTNLQGGGVEITTALRMAA